MRKIAALEKVDIDQDPREALLKYAKVMINLFHELLPLVANVLVSHFHIIGYAHGKDCFMLVILKLHV